MNRIEEIEARLNLFNDQIINTGNQKLDTMIAFYQTDVRDLIDHIKELEAQRAWRPIETAPNDGWILITQQGSERSYVARWWESSNGGYEKWQLSETAFLSPYWPTHWQPLPEPPKEKE